MNARMSLTRTAFATMSFAMLALPPLGRAPVIDGTAAFERLKTLKGTWESAKPDGQKATSTFELTANDAVLLERYTNSGLPGGGQMVTAYHLDGRALVLTHYCIAKNQPTLRAERFDEKTGEIQFEFLRASNLPNENSGHMRRALYRIDDADHFTTSWDFFKDGKKTMTELEKFTRVR
jgi:hypothetical protein